MKTAQKDSRPSVSMIASLEAPSAAHATYRAFSMRCQEGVAIKPSNVTVESITITKTTSDAVMLSLCSKPAPGGRNLQVRRDGAISVGLNFARMPKASAKGSAWVSQVARPKRYMPVHERTE